VPIGVFRVGNALVFPPRAAQPLPAAQTRIAAQTSESAIWPVLRSSGWGSWRGFLSLGAIHGQPAWKRGDAPGRCGDLRCVFDTSNNSCYSGERVDSAASVRMLEASRYGESSGELGSVMILNPANGVQSGKQLSGQRNIT